MRTKQEFAEARLKKARKKAAREREIDYLQRMLGIISMVIIAFQILLVAGYPEHQDDLIYQILTVVQGILSIPALVLCVQLFHEGYSYNLDYRYDDEEEDDD